MSRPEKSPIPAKTRLQCLCDDTDHEFVVETKDTDATVTVSILCLKTELNDRAQRGWQNALKRNNARLEDAWEREGGQAFTRVFTVVTEDNAIALIDKAKRTWKDNFQKGEVRLSETFTVTPQ